MKILEYEAKLIELSKPSGENDFVADKMNQLEEMSTDLIKKLKFCIVLFANIQRDGMKNKAALPAVRSKGTPWANDDWERFIHLLDDGERGRANMALKWLGELE